MTINIDNYMSANPSLTFTQAMQAIVDMREAVFVPKSATMRTITAPIRFKEMLHIIGEEAIQMSYNPGSGPVLRPWSAIYGGDLKGRPMFAPYEFYLDCDNVYRTMPTSFTASYTNDSPIDADEALPFVGNQHIVLENVALYNDDSFGTIGCFTAPHPWTIKRCVFGARNRGLVLAGSFLGHMEQCDFTLYGASPASWFNLSGAVVDRYLAGTASVGELAAIATVEDRIRKAYLLLVAGNATVIGCRLNSGYTGMVVNGNNTVVLNLAIERCLNALVVGGYPMLDIDTLSRSETTNPALSAKPNWSASGCLLQSLGFESNWGGIEVHSGAGNRFQDWVVIGDNCRDLAGRDTSNGGTGLARWGIRNVSDTNANYDGLQSVVNEQTPSKQNLRSIADPLGPGMPGTPFTINETQTIRSRIDRRKSVEELNSTQKQRFLAAIGGQPAN